MGNQYAKNLPRASEYTRIKSSLNRGEPLIHGGQVAVINRKISELHDEIYQLEEELAGLRHSSEMDALIAMKRETEEHRLKRPNELYERARAIDALIRERSADE